MVFVRQMDTHQAKNKAAPPPDNLTVIVIQVCIFFLAKFAILPQNANSQNKFMVIAKIEFLPP